MQMWLYGFLAKSNIPSAGFIIMTGTVECQEFSLPWFQHLICLKSIFTLIRVHSARLRFQDCSQRGSCEQRHEKHQRWRERSHGESCVHLLPTCTHRVWSKPLCLWRVYAFVQGQIKMCEKSDCGVHVQPREDTPTLQRSPVSRIHVYMPGKLIRI